MNSSAGKVILLTNRQILRGEVAIYGDDYLITQPTSEVRIARDRVEHICPSMQEAYRYLKHQTRFGSAGGHLHLAQWCLDEGLTAEAQEQLEEGILKKPNHRRIDLIRRQLEAIPTDGEAISAASDAEQPYGDRDVFAPTDADALETLSRSVPNRTIESFTRTIQPLLLNGCGTRGCHGGEINQFKLHRSTRGHQLPRRLTLRNMQAVLMWVDKKNVNESPLLHFASTPHFSKRTHGASQPLSPDSLQTRQLLHWLDRFADRARDAAVAQHAPANAPPTDVVAGPPGPGDNRFLYSPQSKPSAEIGSSNLSRSIANTPRQPRDPFDADIFNRRHHPQGPPAKN
ncbi:MAG: hypothetical protein P8K78_00850 [Pirellulales bacterium]|nr:hypothetical protein [Pirellulales bacterium]